MALENNRNRVSGPPVCSLKDLRIRDRNGKTLVDGVSFSLAKGETLGLVGESGSGKTLTCKALLNLLPEGLTETASEKRLLGRTAMIFQNPVGALDPLCPVFRQIREVLRVHGAGSLKDSEHQAALLLKRLDLPAEWQRQDRYPFELSGGQCQRVLIAMALACRPELLVCDEPTTALDVMVQKKTLELLEELQAEWGFGMIFVTHNLAVAARLCSRLLIMKNGKMVEEGTCGKLLAAPEQEYTRHLIESVPCIPEIHSSRPHAPGTGKGEDHV